MRSRIGNRVCIRIGNLIKRPTAGRTNILIIIVIEQLIRFVVDRFLNQQIRLNNVQLYSRRRVLNTDIAETHVGRIQPLVTICIWKLSQILIQIITAITSYDATVIARINQFINVVGHARLDGDHENIVALCQSFVAGIIRIVILQNSACS